MAKKKKCPGCPAGEKWAVPYADFLSLLLALFIALYAISAVNKAKVESLKTEFIKIFDFPDSKSLKNNPQGAQASDSAKTSQSKAQASSRAGTETTEVPPQQSSGMENRNLALDQVENQIAINLPTAIKFENMNAEVPNEMTNVVHIISMMISKLPGAVSVEVRGYADDNGDVLRDYKLGAERSFNVLKMIASDGIDPNMLRYSSYGEKHDKPEHAKAVRVFFRIDNRDLKLRESILDMVLNTNYTKLPEEE